MLFGAYLGDRNNVTVFTRRSEQAGRLNKDGVRVLLPSGSSRQVKVRAETRLERAAMQHFLIIAVKQYDLSGLQSSLEAIPAETPLLFIQNGMGHVELLEKLPHETIYVATVEHGAERTDDATVSHNGTGKTNIALFKGTGGPEHVPASNSEVFRYSFHTDYERMLTEKLMTNAIINPLTAILSIKNGDLLENKHYYQLFREFYEETASILPIEDKENMFLKLVSICRSTSDNTSSMLKDLKKGKQTEIDAILGYILQAAERKGKRPASIRMIYEMVKGLEKDSWKGDE